MAADAPQLSAAFDARVMRRLRPRRLTPIGRVVMAVYIVVAAATAVWLIRDLPVASVVAAALVGLSVAVAAKAYGQRLAFRPLARSQTGRGPATRKPAREQDVDALRLWL
jgi:4-amino-4-deoxy-L-arabinose transferase-like glycosyltransferase